MKRLLALAIASLVVVPGTALAATPDEAVAGLDDGVFVEDGVSADPGSLAASVNRARDAGLGLYVVLLDEDPTGGATTFADSVLNRLGSGTVLVLSAGGEGMASTEIDQQAIEKALDAGFSAGGGDEGYVNAVVASLTGAATSDGGGGSGLIVLLVMVGGLIVLVWFVIRRSRKSSERRRAGLVTEARAEIKAQLDSMANTILEITDIVSASEPGEDDDYLEKAGATYATALESYEEATDLGALEKLSDRLDEARWELDAAAAISADRPAPPKPEKKERPVCFFDPTHRDATELAEIKTATGTRTVRVCRGDAERLRRGAQPKPRMINVGGRSMPAPMAPRSHGGGGMDWLEVFSMAAGGAGQAMSYDWGRSRGRSSSRRSGTGSRSSRQAPGTRARAGRTRRRRR